MSGYRAHIGVLVVQRDDVSGSGPSLDTDMRRIRILPMIDESGRPVWRLPDPRVPFGTKGQGYYEFALTTPSVPFRVVSAWIDIPPGIRRFDLDLEAGVKEGLDR